MATVKFSSNKLYINRAPSNNNSNWLKRVSEEVFAMMPANIRRLLSLFSEEQLYKIEEIRMRKGRNISFKLADRDVTITEQGEITKDLKVGYVVQEIDMINTLQHFSDSSVYALEEEFRRGFITIRGGHRVGIIGKAVLVNGQVKTQKDFSSLNIRLAREVKGVAEQILPSLIDKRDGTIHHVVIISPPGCGKTTLLRDLIRVVSDGCIKNNLQGVDVGLVDERSEIASCYKGAPQNNVGNRTDVLDGCPKSQGMIILLRSMNPKIIATDEIGGEQDVLALQEILNCGVKIATTVHGYQLSDLINKPLYQVLERNRAKVRYVLLSKRLGPGTVEGVYDSINGDNLLKKETGHLGGAICYD